ncbi:MAG: hypothetical protein IJO54_02640 [Oscillospiraceae bacterium]|nr:hypothetical protein [Oscillospiraceae bacterium]
MFYRVGNVSTMILAHRHFFVSGIFAAPSGCGQTHILALPPSGCGQTHILALPPSGCCACFPQTNFRPQTLPPSDEGGDKNL